MLSLNKSCKNRKVSLTIHRKYEYFDSTVQRAEDRRQKFYFCRSPFAVNVKLNLSINRACSGPYWENIGPWSFLFGPRCARSVLSRPRADILPVRPSRLVNKIYITKVLLIGFPQSGSSPILTCVKYYC